MEAAALVSFKAPAEVKARVPEVAVLMVRLPEVLVQALVPLEARVRAEPFLPMLMAVALVVPRLMVAVPEPVIVPVVKVKVPALALPPVPRLRM